MNDTVTPAATNQLVNLITQKFHFKTEKLRNEQGAIIGDGKKHPAVEVALPVPSIQRLQEYLADPAKYAKEVELLISTLTDQVYRVARGQINDAREKTADLVVTAGTLNYAKLDWTAIANMPKSERASSIPADEDITGFLESYKLVMPTALNKSVKSIENHLLCFTTGFKKQRSQKDILEVFQNALNVYLTSAGEAAVEEHADVIEFFANKLARFLKVEENITMEDI